MKSQLRLVVLSAEMQERCKVVDACQRGGMFWAKLVLPDFQCSPAQGLRFRVFAFCAQQLPERIDGYQSVGIFGSEDAFTSLQCTAVQTCNGSRSTPARFSRYSPARFSQSALTV
jgi:hypothetical protein